MANVTIIQLATPNIDEYACYSIASVRKYALLNQYEYYVQRSKTLNDLHINWSRLDILLKKLEESPEEEDSYVVMLDADTVIINPQRPIHYFTNKYQKKDSVIFLARDTPFRVDFKKKPNAGFVIIRNNKTGKEIIKKWINAAYNEGKEINDIHPRTQGVYWKYVEPKYKDHQIVLPRSYFHKPLPLVPKPSEKHSFLYHITSTEDKKRSHIMRQFYEEVWGDDENLREVHDLLKKNRENFIKVV